MLTNHGAVLVYLNSRPRDTVRSMAAVLGMSERTVATVIADLRSEGYIAVRRNGRRNEYVINHDVRLKRTFFPGTTLGDFLHSLRIPLAPPSPRD
jgi:predicted transcriptional regulator